MLTLRFFRSVSNAIRIRCALCSGASATMAVVWMLLTPAATAHAQDTADGNGASALRREILAQDAQLGEAYNRCKIAVLKRLFSSDAELYFADRGKTDRVYGFTDAVRSKLCGSFRRETDPDTHAVYALPGHIGTLDGAIQVGAQSFCAAGETPCRGVRMQFIAVWRRIDGEWKISRMIRYGYADTL
jgi:hypothetical protein